MHEKDAVARTKASNVRTAGFHRSGPVAPENGRKAVRIEGAGLAELVIHGVDACRVETDEKVPFRRGRGVRDLGVLKNVRASRPVQNNRFHGSRPFGTDETRRIREEVHLGGRSRITEVIRQEEDSGRTGECF
jgi:hypothetical protein